MKVLQDSKVTKGRSKATFDYLIFCAVGTFISNYKFNYCYAKSTI